MNSNASPSCDLWSHLSDEFYHYKFIEPNFGQNLKPSQKDLSMNFSLSCSWNLVKSMPPFLLLLLAGIPLFCFTKKTQKPSSWKYLNCLWLIHKLTLNHDCWHDSSLAADRRESVGLSVRMLLEQNFPRIFKVNQWIDNQEMEGRKWEGRVSLSLSYYGQEEKWVRIKAGVYTCFQPLSHLIFQQRRQWRSLPSSNTFPEPHLGLAPAPSASPLNAGQGSLISSPLVSQCYMVDNHIHLWKFSSNLFAYDYQVYVVCHSSLRMSKPSCQLDFT